MNLRNVTKWTTLLLLIVTVAVPIYGIVILAFGFHVNEMGLTNAIALASFFWLFSSSPLVVSLVIADKVEHDSPAIVLLGSTIGYGVFYIYALFQTFFVDGWMILGVCLAGIVMLPVLLPCWIIALRWNRYYATKTPDPETAASTPSSPALLGGESEVK